MRVPGNDLFGRTFEAISDGLEVDFFMRHDFNPQETSWRLEDSEGNTLYAGGPYPDLPSTAVITEAFCLHPDSLLYL